MLRTCAIGIAERADLTSDLTSGLTFPLLYTFCDVKTIEVMFTEGGGPISIFGSTFQLFDPDPVDTMVTVTLEVAIDFNNASFPVEDLMFNTTGTTVDATMSLMPTFQERQFSLQYTLYTNASQFSDHESVLQRALYNNIRADSNGPSVTPVRRITVNITQPSGFIPCTATINIINVNMPPRILIDEFLLDRNFIEGGDPVQLVRDGLLNIVDRDNNNLAYVTLVTGAPPPGVQDTLVPVIDIPDITVDYGGGANITLQAANEVFAPISSFVTVLNSVTFSSNQTGCYEPRSILVQAFGHPSVPSNVVTFTIEVQPTPNSPMVVMVNPQRTDPLEDYLASNEGFNVSFLLSEHNVIDPDRPSCGDFIGIVITGLEDGGIGAWQYRRNDSYSWQIIPKSSSDCSGGVPFQVDPATRIRFQPEPNFTRPTGDVYLEYHAWDGSLPPCYGPYSSPAVDSNMYRFIYSVEYLNRPPVIQQDQYLLTPFDEDSDLSKIPNTTVANIVAFIAIDMDNIELGLLVIGVNPPEQGVWEYGPFNTTWESVPSNVSLQYALHIANNLSIRFIPTADFYGNAGLTVLAADGTQPYQSVYNVSSFEQSTSPFSANSSEVVASVLAVNDPPQVDLTTTELVFTEGGGPVLVFPNITITDVDSPTLVCGSILLTRDGRGNVAGDQLLWDSTSLTVSNYSSMTNLEYEFTGENAPVDDFTQILRSVRFDNVELETLELKRTVVLIVTDDVTSTLSTVTITVTLINDETPVVTLPNTTVEFIEDSSPLQLFPQGVRIEDSDNNTLFPMEEIRLSLSQHDPTSEWLYFDGGGLNVSITAEFTEDVLHLRGPVEVAGFELALSGVYYINNNTEPTGNPRQVSVVVDDGEHISEPQILNITIILINDQLPSVLLDPPSINSTAVFYENNPISPPILIAPNVSIIDIDSDSRNFPYHSAVIHLTNALDGTDEFLGVDQSQYIPSHVNIEETEGSTVLNITSSTDQLYFDVLIPILSRIQYNNTAVEPSSVTRVIEFVLYDRLFSGVNSSSPSYVSVVVTLADDLPVVLFGRVSVMYSEGDPPVLLAPGLTVTDVDDDELSRAVVWISNVHELGVMNPGTEILSVSDEALNNTGLEVFPSAGQLEIRGEASLQTYQIVLRTLTYNNSISEGDPVEGNRNIMIFVEGVRNDTRSTTDIMTVMFTAVDNSPILDLNGPGSPGRDYRTTFTEEGAAVNVVGQDFVLDDVDSLLLTSLQVTLVTPLADDMLVGGDNTNLTVEYSASSILVTGPRSIREFSDVLSSILFHNPADEPPSGKRTILVNVSDGVSSPSIQTTIVDVVLINDIPKLYLNGDSFDTNVTFTENGPPVSLAPAALLVDDSRFYSELSIRLQEPQNIVHLLNWDEFVFDNITLTFVLSFTNATIDDVVGAIQSLVYQNQDDEPGVDPHVFCMTVVDEEGAPSNEACSTVYILPVNDNPPVFTATNIEASIAEDQINQMIIFIGVSDNDVSLEETIFTYAFVGGDCFYQSCPFVLQPVSNGVSIVSNNSIDYEEQNQFVFVLQVSDGELTSTVNVTINISDVDDNAPQFLDPVYSFEVTQGSVRGDVIGIVDAFDVDTVGGPVVFLCLGGSPDIPCGNTTSPFSLNSTTGEISLNTDEDMLDETVPQYILQVQASSHSGLFDTVDVYINVSLNDNNPTFRRPSYFAEVEESFPINTTILSILADDPDEGSHGNVQYFIAGVFPPPSRFAVDPSSGDIVLTSPLDYDQGDRMFVIAMVAQDSGRPVRTSSVNVTIAVSNVNEHAPMFDPNGVYTATVCEGTSVPQELLQLTATDLDSDHLGSVEYSLVDNNNGLFGINATTGSLQLLKVVDYEVNQLFGLTIEVNDGGNMSSTRNVSVHVLNINDNPPVFPLPWYTFTVSENDLLGSFVSTYSYPAVDSDGCGEDQCEDGRGNSTDPTCLYRSPQLHYTIEEMNETLPFNIVPETGRIYINQSLDLEAGSSPQYSFMVTVTDGKYQDSTTVVIEVMDVNEFPPVFDPTLPSMLQFVEGYNGIVVNVSVRDKDADQAGDLVLFLEGDNSDDFEISTSGIVRTRAPLDRDTTSTYNLTVVAMDISSQPRSSEYTVYIVVTDINDTPPMFNSTMYTLRVSENRPQGEVVGQVFARDPDTGEGGRFSYSLAGEDAVSFYINSTTGVILTRTVFDREVTDAYHFYVVGIDNGYPSLTSSVMAMVVITDENDHTPVFNPVNSNITVAEDHSILVPVLLLNASDSDIGRNAELHFALLNTTAYSNLNESRSSGQLNTENYFMVDEMTGRISLIRPLDYDIGIHVLALNVEVRDSGDVVQLSATTIVRISVEDVNDNPPVFERSSVNSTIPEHSPVGTTVTRLVASDADSGDNGAIQYVIDEVQPSRVEPAFSINTTTGILTVADSNVINIEDVRFISVYITAFNPFHPFDPNATAQVLVVLTDINEFTPMFSQERYVFNITEDDTPVEGLPGSSVDEYRPRPVGMVTATDMDTPYSGGGMVRYSIFSGNEDGMFRIDEYNGSITSILPLDRESTGFYHLVVIAQDMDDENPRSSNATVTITILDIDDNDPSFDFASYNISVRENTPNGTYIDTITAVDPDLSENAIIDYMFVDDLGLFVVDSNTARITLSGPLDREEQSSYTVVLVANEVAMTTVSITVLDENDNVPIVIPANVRINLTEDTQVTREIPVYTFDVTDADIGSNAISNITVTGDSDNFDADVYGRVFLVQPLDFETQPQILEYTVTARNTEPPHLMSEPATFVVEILNVNDIPPVLSISQETATLLEISSHVGLDPGASIADNDGADISTVEYFAAKILNPLAEGEVSVPFEPTAASVPYVCSEDKGRKYVGCGYSTHYQELLTAEVLRGTTYRLMNNPSVVDGRVIVFDGVDQYVLLSRILPSLQSGGVTFSMFVWKESHLSSRTSSMTLLSKTTSTMSVYALSCDPNNTLVFSYRNSSRQQETVTFSQACNRLESAWHQLTLSVFLDPVSNRWRANLVIDGSLFGWTYLLPPYDTNQAAVYLAALGDPARDFFPGRLSDVYVFSDYVSTPNVLCASGCGVALGSSLTPPPLPYSYNYTSRTLTALFSGQSEDYIPLINSLMFIQPFVEPFSREYQILYVVNDGIFDSAPRTGYVIIETFNDHNLEISTNGGQDFVTVFVEDGDPIRVVNETSFILTDNDLSAFDYTLTITITRSPDDSAQDILSITDRPSGMNSTFDGTSLVLTGFLPISVFRTALLSVTYINTADEPIDGERELSLVISDPSFTSEPARTFITIQRVNDLPQVTFEPSGLEFDEKEGPMRVFDSVTITDDDGLFITMAVLQLSGFDGSREVLSVNNTNDILLVNYDANTTTLTIDGNATLETYSLLIQTLTYDHLTSFGDPTSGTRTITITVTDGDVISMPVEVAVFFAAVNDRPMVYLQRIGVPNVTVSFVEDTYTPVAIVNQTAAIVDVDNETLSLTTVSLTNPLDGPYEHIHGQSGESVIVETGTNGHTLRLLPREPLTSASIEDFVRVLSTLTYINTAEEPTVEDRIIQVVASDGLADSTPVYSMVEVVPVNDAPQLDLDPLSNRTDFTTVFLEEGSGVAITSPNVTLTDNDKGARITSIQIYLFNATDGSLETVISPSSYPRLVKAVDNTTNTNMFLFMYNMSGTTPSNARDFLASLLYVNEKSEPTAGLRELKVEVFDDVMSVSNPARSYITVENINDHSPVIVQTSLSSVISEGGLIGETVVVVMATDGDAGSLDGGVRYAITVGNSRGHFVINAVTGVITTNTTLDREDVSMYTLVVGARDLGSPERFAEESAFVGIRVLDINDVAPQIVDDVVSVSETAGVGSVVDMLEGVDGDLGANGTFRFVLVNGGQVPSFNVSSSGVIVVTFPLDADEGPQSTDLTVLIEDMGEPPLSSQKTISVIFTFENEFPPVFNETFLDFVLPEGNDCFFLVAVDSDRGKDGEVEYRFVDNATYSLFSLNVTSGEVCPIVELDVDGPNAMVFHSIGVTASDLGNPPFMTSAVVNLTVEDINDNVPFFLNVPSSLSLPEDTSVSDVVFTVRANDIDKGKNRELVYSLLDAITSPFTIDDQSGNISLVASLDYEIVQAYNLTVGVSDLGDPPLSATALLTVKITNINDNAPSFSQQMYNTSVFENMLNVTLVNVSAVDNDLDPSSSIVYSLVEDHSSTFSVDPGTGVLRLISPLDFETQCEYYIAVVATDTAYPPLSSTSLVYLRVLNVIDESPEFTSSDYLFRVLENAAVGTFVGNVHGEMVDGSNCNHSRADTYGVEYMIVNSSEFNIDPTTGNITTSVVLDREAVGMYTFEVMIVDSTNLSSSTSVTVRVEDVNDNSPRFMAPGTFGVSIAESEAVGNIVYQLVADDSDELDQGLLQFGLIEQPDLPFNITSSGEVVVSQMLDFDTDGRMFSFTAFVVDTADQNDTAIVTINVTDTNDIPPIIEGITPVLEYMEGQAEIGIFLFTTLNITDPDVTYERLEWASISLSTPHPPNTQETCTCEDMCPEGCYELIQFNQSLFQNGQFQIQNGSRAITLSGALPISDYVDALRSMQYVNVIQRPMPTSRTVILQVFDGKLTTTQLVTIVLNVFNGFPPVVDINGPDVTGEDYTIVFTEESQPMNIVSSSVSISDADSFQPSGQLTSLTIVLTNPLDGSQESLSVTSGIIDVSIQILTDTFNLNVTFAGPASHSAYLTALRLVQYSNTADEPDVTPRRISVTSFEGHLNHTSYVYVTFSTVNDKTPTISYIGGTDYSTDYTEGSPGVPIFTGTIADLDTGNDTYLSSVRIQLQDPTPQDELFVQNMSAVPSLIRFTFFSTSFVDLVGRAVVSDYEVALREVLYRSTVEEFTVDQLVTKIVQFTLSDGASQSTAETRITIRPVNDQIPVFSQSEYIFNVSEDAMLSHEVGSVSASDGDTLVPGSMVVYQLVGNESNALLNIDSTSGQLYLKSSLNYEETTTHTLYVQAVDSLYTGPLPPNQARIILNVVDVNDNPPIFDPSLYNVSVGEGVPLDTHVVTVTANDIDTPPHSVVVYSLIGSSDFQIDQSSGLITTAGDIDRERQEVYNLTVTASNPGLEVVTTAVVIINVLDLDDNDPVIYLSPSIGTLVEPEVLSSLAVNLTIVDPDPNPSLVGASVLVHSTYSGSGVLILPYGNSLEGVTLQGNETQHLSLTGLAALSLYEHLLQGVLFYDPSTEPIPGTVSISFEVQASPNVSNSSLFALTVHVINDNPPILLLSDCNASVETCFEVDLTVFVGGDSLNTPGTYFALYVENGPTVSLSNSSLSITDEDSGDNSISYAVVSIIEPLDDEEELTVQLEQGVTLSAVSTPQLLVLDGPVSLVTMETVLKTVRYRNGAVQPQGNMRRIDFVVNDSTFNSSVVSTHVYISPVNDLPQVYLAHSSVDVYLMYTEGQSGPLSLAPNATITDVDNTRMMQASIVVEQPSHEEHISVGYIPVGVDIVRISNSSLTVRAVGGLAIDEFIRVLRSVQYVNSIQRLYSPTELPRTVTFIVTDDGGAASDPAVARINFVAIDNPPTLDLNGRELPGTNYTTTFSEGQPPTPVSSANVSIIDMDSTNATLLTAILMDVMDETSESLFASLSYNLNVIITDDGNSSSLTLSGLAGIATYTDVVRSLRYYNNRSEPTPGLRRVEFQITTLGEDGEESISYRTYTSIDIIPVNDNSPVFDQSSYLVTVFENTPPDTPLNVTVSASDGDIHGDTNITYHLQTSPHSELFHINIFTGVISTAGTIDYEVVGPQVELNVVARDNDTPSSLSGTVSVLVYVIDVNDNIPAFPRPYENVTVAENVSLDTVILTLSAGDNDSGSNAEIAYSIVDSQIPFVVNSSTGGVSVSGPLDYEAATMYSFQIVASDGGMPTLSSSVIINVSVMDVNDNVPVIGAISNLSLDEDTRVPTLLTTVTASDNDSSLNGEVRYSFKFNETLFAINSTSGAIHLVDSLDYETQTEHVVTIIATDLGRPPLTSEAAFYVHVGNVNDNPPMFNPDYVRVEVNESSPPLNIFQATASDADGDVPTYSLSSPYFTIDRATGVITTTVNLDREDVDRFSLHVTANDTVFTSTLAVDVVVLDINDNAPVFTKDVFVFNVSESQLASTVIAMVTASDADLGQNAQLTYGISDSSSQAIFSINATTGEISLLQKLDYENAHQHIVTITVSDSGIPSLNSTGTLVINVIDVNDAQPIVILSNTNVTYYETNSTVLPLGGTVIADLDGAAHLITMATVTLTTTCTLTDEELVEPCNNNSNCVGLCGELLGVDATVAGNRGLLVERSVNTTQDGRLLQYLVITGAASEEVYSAVLSTVTYTNMVKEPADHRREICVQVQDASLTSDAVCLSLYVVLVNEFCPMLSAANERVVFREGHFTSLWLGPVVLFTVSDMDHPPHDVINNASIVLSGHLDGHQERLTLPSTNSVSVTSSFNSDRHVVLSLMGSADSATYQSLLNQLLYTNEATEPTAGTRRITVALHQEGVKNCVPLVLEVEVIPINDNAPNLTVANDTVTYEEESGPQLVVEQAGLHLTDADDVQGFGIEMATIVLSGIEDTGEEVLGYNSASVPNGVNVSEMSTDTTVSLIVEGPGSVQEYLTLLLSITYHHTLPEPTQGNRTISMTVFDSQHQGMTALIVLVVVVSDHPPMLSANTTIITILESDSLSLPIGMVADLRLTDVDRHEVIMMMNAQLQGVLDPEEEFITWYFNNQWIRSNNGWLNLTDTGTVDDFQAIISTITYNYTTRSEPLPGQRSVTLYVSDNVFTANITISIDIDHPPMLSANTTAITILEGDFSSPIGMVADLRLTDVDRHEVIMMMNAQLQGVLDPEEEFITWYFNNQWIRSNNGWLNLTDTGTVDDFQVIISTISYNHTTRSELLPGQRSVTLYVSDNVYTVNITIFIDIDFPPMLSANTTNITLKESLSLTSPIGMVADLRLTDADRHEVIMMMNAQLQGVLDPEEEFITWYFNNQWIRSSNGWLNLTDTGTVGDFEAIFSTITYNYTTKAEPLPGQRNVTLYISDNFYTVNITVYINIEVDNDVAPTIKFDGPSVLTFVEGSMTLLNLGGRSGLSVDDGDGLVLYQANVTLFGMVDGADEYISVENRERIRNMGLSVQTNSDSTELTITGPASSQDYTEVLRMLTYSNVASEPTRQNRTVTISVFDGIFHSNTATVTITIDLIHDSPLVINGCGDNPIYYVEEAGPVRIAPNLTLMDADVDHVIVEATVRIVSSGDGDTLGAPASSVLSVDTASGVHISGSAMTSQYQEILQGVTFNNQLLESSPQPSRMIVISITDGINITECRVPVVMNLINDNIPMVDLNGANGTTTNYEVNVTFSSQPIDVAIATKAAILDEDLDSRIVSMVVTKDNVLVDDFLLVNICPVDDSDVCSIFWTMNGLQCSCHSGQLTSDSTADIILYRNRSHLLFSRSVNSLVANSVFEDLLNNHTRFHHGTLRPPTAGSYTTTITVEVSDGSFRSAPSTTTVNVQVNNNKPVVLLDGQLPSANRSVQMMDGEVMIPITTDSHLADDYAQIYQLVVIINNPQDVENESLVVDSAIAQQHAIAISYGEGSLSLVLNGPAGLQQYKEVLDSVSYTYTRMAGIIQNQPDFTERYIAVHVVDSDGEESATSTLTVNFSTECTVWPENTIAVPSMVSLAHVGICSSISPSLELSISSSSNIFNLEALKNLKSVGLLRIQNLPNIYDLSGLENLRQFSSIIIQMNNNIRSMRNLSANVQDSAYQTVMSVLVVANPRLRDVEGLRTVQNITGSLILNRNPLLVDLSGLDHLERTGSIYLISLPHVDFSWLTGVRTTNRLTILQLNSLVTISGLNRLYFVGDLNILYCLSLVNIDGLSSIQLVRTVLINSPSLCYILDVTPTEGYWNQRLDDPSTEIAPSDVTISDNCPVRLCDTSTNPCLNGGSCADNEEEIGGYTCSCSGFHYGTGCQSYNYCNALQPCNQNETCILANDPTNPQGFVCFENV